MSRWTAVLASAVVGVGLAAAAAGLVLGSALGSALGWATEEWHCSQGRAPAHNRAGGSDCFREGSALPTGWRWDRWGNRPMSYDCDGPDWVEVTDRSENRADCVRAGTRLPVGWRPVDH